MWLSLPKAKSGFWLIISLTQRTQPYFKSRAQTKREIAGYVAEKILDKAQQRVVVEVCGAQCRATPADKSHLLGDHEEMGTKLILILQYVEQGSYLVFYWHRRFNSGRASLPRIVQITTFVRRTGKRHHVIEFGPTYAILVGDRAMRTRRRTMKKMRMMKMKMKMPTKRCKHCYLIWCQQMYMEIFSFIFHIQLKHCVTRCLIVLSYAYLLRHVQFYDNIFHYQNHVSSFPRVSLKTRWRRFEREESLETVDSQSGLERVSWSVGHSLLDPK